MQNNLADLVANSSVSVDSLRRIAYEHCGVPTDTDTQLLDIWLYQRLTRAAKMAGLDVSVFQSEVFQNKSVVNLINYSLSNRPGTFMERCKASLHESMSPIQNLGGVYGCLSAEVVKPIPKSHYEQSGEARPLTLVMVLEPIPGSSNCDFEPLQAELEEKFLGRVDFVFDKGGKSMVTLSPFNDKRDLLLQTIKKHGYQVVNEKDCF